MTPWWQGRMAGFDLETTSADPEEARIVTAALAVVGGGEPAKTRTWLVDPGVEIPDEAAEVHGITTEVARRDGEPPFEALSSIVSLSRFYVQPLVIFNARYDLTVLDRECRRHGIEPPTIGCVVDPLVIDKHLDRYRKGSRKLDAICTHYVAALGGAHDASHDALAAARVAWRIGERGQVVRKVWNEEMGREKAALVREWDEVRNDLRALHDAQVRWAREQALGLAEHFRGKGQVEDADGVRVEWPVIPMEVEHVEHA